MNVVHLHITVDSETLHIPESKGFMGKKVELRIVEEEKSEKEKQMNRFFSASGNVEIDEEAVLKLREESKL